MMISWLWNKRGRNEGCFKSAKLAESSDSLKNPGCGWYHIYTFYAHCPAKKLWIEDDSEEIVLLLIDIGHFKKAALSFEALENIRALLSFFAAEGKNMIIRIAYDTKGQGMLCEPDSMALVQTHMRQLGPLLSGFADNILVLQGIFVGSWGEMHDSKFLSDTRLCQLAETLLEAVEYKCSLAVRKPSQLRCIAKKCSKKAAQRLALFNDGIFGSVTDLGTYDSEEDRTTGLLWQQENLSARFNGGEVIGKRKGMDAAGDFYKMHISYINSVYNKESLDMWKSEIVLWPGLSERLSAYDYIGRHLGYRFTVREVSSKKDCLKITVENTGFANLCQKADCLLIIETAHGNMCINIETDARCWESGTCTDIYVPLDIHIQKSKAVSGCTYYVQLRRSCDKRIIYFANEGAGERLLIGQS